MKKYKGQRINMNRMYIVTAYRYSDREKHSYVVAVCDSEEIARQLADREENNRAGKYECEITSHEINSPDEGEDIKPLPDITLSRVNEILSRKRK